MRYAFEKISRKTRLLIMALLLMLMIVVMVVEGTPDFFSGFVFGLLIIFVVAEVAIFLRLKKSNN